MNVALGDDAIDGRGNPQIALDIPLGFNGRARGFDGRLGGANPGAFHIYLLLGHNQFVSGDHTRRGRRRFHAVKSALRGGHACFRFGLLRFERFHLRFRLGDLSGELRRNHGDQQLAGLYNRAAVHQHLLNETGHFGVNGDALVGQELAGQLHLPFHAARDHAHCLDGLRF